MEALDTPGWPLLPQGNSSAELCENLENSFHASGVSAVQKPAHGWSPQVEPLGPACCLGLLNASEHVMAHHQRAQEARAAGTPASLCPVGAKSPPGAVHLSHIMTVQRTAVGQETAHTKTH